MRNLLLKMKPSAPTKASVTSALTEWCADGSASDLPRWATQYTNGTGSTIAPPKGGIEIIDRSHGGTRHRTAILRDAIHLDEAAFTEQAHATYIELLRGVQCDRIFRIWNFIPRIGQRDSSGIDRYMRFNTARFKAFEQNGPSKGGYPPASGVGHAGNDLVLHLLESDVSILSLDNPRQVPPREYSRTWGPLPPVFARGAIVDGLQDSRLVIASGTASVRGEDTVFEDNLDRQLDETRENLTRLISEARQAAIDANQPRLDSMLVYVTRREHVDAVRTRVESEFLAPGAEVEYRLGPLCRSELLVEVEGIHVLTAADARS